MTEQHNTQTKNSWGAFKAMVKRDLLVQLRDKWEFVFRVAMLPFMLILLYGYILPRIGLVSNEFPNQMFPGIVGMSILVTGIHGTAIPLTIVFEKKIMELIIEPLLICKIRRGSMILVIFFLD